MGIYTNAAFGGYSSSNYTSVEPFKGDHFNYHELGIIAAAESAANQNAFMKAIALQELASMEQYGNTEVMYESVNVKGIFEKIKAFFKKIIEKIHKIFHTFVAKMASWFGNNRDFAKKYEKEIVKNWSQISNDFEFKGYVFKFVPGTKGEVSFAGLSREDLKEKIDTQKTELDGVIADPGTLKTFLGGYSKIDVDEDVRKTRDKLDDIKDGIRADWIKKIKSDYSGTSLDSKEYTEELFKVFRSGEDSKDDMNKSKVLESYGNSVNGMMSFIREFDKIKTEIEKGERTFTKGIDDIISKLNKAEDELVKENRDNSKKVNDNTAENDTNGNPSTVGQNAKKAIADNETIIGVSSLIQSVVGFEKECGVQAFSALLQATKDACTQAKEIAVKVIGLNKKMTESADYSSDGNTTSTAFGGDFISAVKLV